MSNRASRIIRRMGVWTIRVGLHPELDVEHAPKQLIVESLFPARQVGVKPLSEPSQIQVRLHIARAIEQVLKHRPQSALQPLCSGGAKSFLLSIRHDIRRQHVLYSLSEDKFCVAVSQLEIIRQDESEFYQTMIQERKTRLH